MDVEQVIGAVWGWLLRPDPEPEWLQRPERTDIDGIRQERDDLYLALQIETGEVSKHRHWRAGFRGLPGQGMTYGWHTAGAYSVVRDDGSADAVWRVYLHGVAVPGAWRCAAMAMDAADDMAADATQAGADAAEVQP